MPDFFYVSIFIDQVMPGGLSGALSTILQQTLSLSFPQDRTSFSVEVRNEWSLQVVWMKLTSEYHKACSGTIPAPQTSIVNRMKSNLN